MSLLTRNWTDPEKWAMGLVSAVVLGSGATIYNTFGGDVVAEIASVVDRHGRCLDAEVRVRNESKADALDIEIAFDVDYFTREGSVALEFGDERDQLIPSGQRTLIPRLLYLPVYSTMDASQNILRVPRLKAGQYIHLFLGGEPRLDDTRASARDELLRKRDSALMNKPRVAKVSRKDGSVTLRHLLECSK